MLLGELGQVVQATREAYRDEEEEEVASDVDDSGDDETLKLERRGTRGGGDGREGTSGGWEVALTMVTARACVCVLVS